MKLLQLLNCNPLEEEYQDYEKMIISESNLTRLKLSAVPPTRHEKYQNLRKVGEKKKLQTFGDFLRPYSNDVVSTLEALQKMVKFHHNKGTDMIKLRCTIPNIANICLNKSFSAKFCPFRESDKELPEKIHKDRADGLAVFFACKIKVDETLIRRSSNNCRSIVGIDANQH